MRYRTLLFVSAVVLPVLVLGCSGPAAGGGNGPPNVNNENVNSADGDSNGLDDIFVADPREDQLVSLRGVNDDGTEYSYDVPGDQILLMFGSEVTRDEAADALARMQADLPDADLEVVGQIPDLGIYQLEIDNPETDPDAALARLDTVIAALGNYAGGVTAGYNVLLTGRAVENNDDNTAIVGRDRCALAVLDYYQAIPVLDRVLSQVTLSDVAVAVVDSNLWVESGQFDEILPRTQFPGQPEGVTPYDWNLHKHGTNIAALLAADNGDGLVNGIALRVLGDRLRLIVGDAHLWGETYSLARALARTRESILLGADIVILSLGRSVGTDRPGWLLRAQDQFSRVFDSAPQTLFIAAAGNENFVLDGNDVPAGMPNPNVLTVGGTQNCLPDQRYVSSCTGPGVELAAPATGIPGFAGDNMFGPAAYFLEGNSFAAPLVGAMAAIVQSIDPSLTGAELKAFLLDEDHTWPTADEVGGRRVALLKTVGSALLTRAAGGVGVDKILDAYGPADDIPDPSGYAVNRLCGAINFSVSGSYSETVALDAPEIVWGSDQYNYGLIGMGHQVILKVSDGGASVMISTTAGFRLNEPYASPPQIVVPSPEGQLVAGMDGSSGTFTLTECELTTRSLPLDWYSPANSGPDQLIFIEVSGTFSGSAQGAIRLSDGERISGVSYAASGTFTTAFMLLDPETDTLDYLEQHCVGGFDVDDAQP